MEPRSFERGKLLDRQPLDPVDTALQWSRVRLNAERSRRSFILRLNSSASMEPRSFERGKSKWGYIARQDYSLQWSRVRLNAESVAWLTLNDPRIAASMEPRSFERGKRSPVRIAGHVVRASMEPRSFERGKLSMRSDVWGYFVLQWSRVRLNAERTSTAIRVAASACFNGAAFV